MPLSASGCRSCIWIGREPGSQKIVFGAELTVPVASPSPIAIAPEDLALQIEVSVDPSAFLYRCAESNYGPLGSRPVCVLDSTGATMICG